MWAAQAHHSSRRSAATDSTTAIRTAAGRPAGTAPEPSTGMGSAPRPTACPTARQSAGGAGRWIPTPPFPADTASRSPTAEPAVTAMSCSSRQSPRVRVRKPASARRRTAIPAAVARTAPVDGWPRTTRRATRPAGSAPVGPAAAAGSTGPRTARARSTCGPPLRDEGARPLPRLRIALTAQPLVGLHRHAPRDAQQSGEIPGRRQAATAGQNATLHGGAQLLRDLCGQGWAGPSTTGSPPTAPDDASLWCTARRLRIGCESTAAIRSLSIDCW